MTEDICENCGKEFESVFSKLLYCSDCQHAFNNECDIIHLEYDDLD